MTNQPNSSAPGEAPLVTVVIVNYNGGEMICQCISALEVQRFIGFTIVVVDNNSTDGSVTSIRTRHPSVLVLEPGSNLGFAGGVNHALRECELGLWVALLNPDAFPTPDWLENLVDAARKHPEYAAFGSRMFSDEERLQLDGVGDAYHVSGLPWRNGHGCKNSARYEQEGEIFAPCAAAALYRTDAIKSIGLFDEDFFLYVEDVDLGFRLRLAGYRALYVPTASVVHLGSAFVGKHSEFQIYHGHRNLVWVYIKNMPGILFWIFLPLHIGLNLVTLVWFSLRGNAGVIFKAKWDALQGIPHYWKKRGIIQATRRVSVWAVLSQLKWNPISRCN
jgi:GT2 family glycosyltransferase